MVFSSCWSQEVISFPFQRKIRFKILYRQIENKASRIESNGMGVEQNWAYIHYSLYFSILTKNNTIRNWRWSRIKTISLFWKTHFPSIASGGMEGGRKWKTLIQTEIIVGKSFDFLTEFFITCAIWSSLFLSAAQLLLFQLDSYSIRSFPMLNDEGEGDPIVWIIRFVMV